MRARQLEVFTAVMRIGTVTGAARMLNISQPALSQVLRHTEDELGFLLFSREKGRLHPTPEALELYPDAERLFAGLEGLRRKSTDLRKGRSGLVRIAASAPPSMSVLPNALAMLRQKHPNIQLRAHVAPINTLISMLRAGDATLALALDDQMPPDICADVIDRTSFCCLMSAQSDLVSASEISFDMLADRTVISYRAQTRPRDELQQAAQAQGLGFQPDLEIDSSITAVGFVQAGLGVALVDALLPWHQFQGVVVRPLANSPKLPLSLLTLKDRPLSQADQIMSAELRAICERDDTE
ncbi:LysR family transcriptional regulator [Pseudophaeobacter sp. TrK17]|jgi:DNA-binding transcriptional LysR family regulator|uniref:LysR family transcriptional regulator n=1 Tax=Pseudophaeobacter sp. TrK17 TaxID=2815167 RepID=UPI0021FB30A1|nr:LysR family transcriptional regulator [Phaeobacter sp. G2]